MLTNGANLLGKISWWSTNLHLTREKRHTLKKYSMSYARILHVYSLVSIDTLARMLKIL